MSESSRKRYLVTSGLPYSNGRLHVGHVAGAYLPADTYVRYLRARGHEVRFVCGSDDNGVAALISAEKQKTTVTELTARYNARQAADFEGMGIRFDIFGGTHQPEAGETRQLEWHAFRCPYAGDAAQRVGTGIAKPNGIGRCTNSE